MDTDRLQTVIDYIKAYPETYNQASYKCGTRYCIAGHAIRIFSPERAVGLFADTNDLFFGSNCQIAAMASLDLSWGEANYLFSAERTLPEIEAYLLVAMTYNLNKRGYYGKI